MKIVPLIGFNVINRTNYLPDSQIKFCANNNEIVKDSFVKNSDLNRSELTQKENLGYEKINELINRFKTLEEESPQQINRELKNMIKEFVTDENVPYALQNLLNINKESLNIAIDNYPFNNLSSNDLPDIRQVQAIVRDKVSPSMNKELIEAVSAGYTTERDADLARELIRKFLSCENYEEFGKYLKVSLKERFAENDFAGRILKNVQNIVLKSIDSDNIVIDGSFSKLKEDTINFRNNFGELYAKAIKIAYREGLITKEQAKAYGNLRFNLGKLKL